MSGNTHVVASGETMIGIAKRHGVTLKALLAANPALKDPNRIRVGQTIAIPAGSVVVPEPVFQIPGALPGGAPVSVPVMPRLPAEDEQAFAAMDKRGKAKALHPIFRERLVMLAGVLARRGMKALITDGLRTFAEQDALFAKGRRGIAGEKKVTNAKGGQSNHNYGIAVDLYPVLPDSAGQEKVFTSVPPNASVEFARAFNETQRAIGEEAEHLGLFWGARFMGIVDTPHIQLFPQHEMSPKECLEIYRRNDETLRAVWDEASRRVRPLPR
ncbi:MAG TPA: LysM peptidoglycan-binding domain-containing protein [Vicinamibacterales bacterium]|nr:LysM peptidoglycan-binding domain-containing protein [Vicinamibacterales bacterium]